LETIDRLLDVLKELMTIPLIVVLSLIIILLLVVSYRNKSNDWKYIPVLLFIAFVFFFTEQFMAAVGFIFKPIMNFVVWITSIWSK